MEVGKLPQFKGKKIRKLIFIDVDYDKWKQLYIAKLKACYKLADFSDSKKD